MTVNEGKLNQFVEKVVGDVGAAISAALVVVGDKLGLYKAMAGAGPLTPAELAQRTGTAERYVREWLMNQAAGGYVEFDGRSGRFTLPPEQAESLANEESPAFLPGAFQIITSVFSDEPRITEAFRTGKGLAWGDHSSCLFDGTARFFGANYRRNLVSSWIPALNGTEAALHAGAKVADVGCGYGISTILMAEAYPRCRFYGFDYHERSIDAARAAAKRAGVADRVEFDTAPSTGYPGKDYDLVACFDALHDMSDPVGCAKHVRETLKDDGTWMIVEPFAGDRPEDNLNPVGRVYYGASTMICVPNSLAFDGPALGAQAGEARLRDVAERGGFRHFRRAAETPFNLVLEARP